MFSPLDLRHLEQIAAIRRAGGFNGAARALGISQPTLSKSIARLEARLGMKLFERGARGATPTAYANYLGERAEALLQSAAQLLREAQQMVDGDSGQVRIGVGPVARLALLPQLVSLAAARFPRLQLSTLQSSPLTLLARLLNGESDVIFVHHEYAESHGDLIRAKILTDDIIVVARAGHPAGDRGPLAPRDLLGYAAATPTVTPAIRAWLGAASPDTDGHAAALFSDDYSVIAQRLLDSDLIAFAPRFAVARELAEGAFIELPITRPAPAYECWMLTTPELWRSPVIRALADAAREASEAPRGTR
ncbi:LysR family transcriptional regulator [Caulobacter sp.]|uniref:LysR family transcriptional regulator n=1 Tax=Caulobacter sp. TaxID=78 RepID=UPI003BAFEAEB